MEELRIKIEEASSGFDSEYSYLQSDDNKIMGTWEPETQELIFKLKKDETLVLYLIDLAGNYRQIDLIFE